MLRISTGGKVIDFPAPILRPECRCWPDPAQAGGWGRALWWGPQPGVPGYQLVALEFSDIVEFGADVVVGTGRNAAASACRRW